MRLAYHSQVKGRKQWLPRKDRYIRRAHVRACRICPSFRRYGASCNEACLVSSHFDGGCACGSVRYKNAARPVFSWNCHCRHCQRASGSGYCPVSYVPKTSLEWSGPITFYEVQADSKNSVRRGFCSSCGSPVLILAELVPELVGVWAATRDNPSTFAATANVWTASSHTWSGIDTKLLSFPRAPSTVELQEIIKRSSFSGDDKTVE